FTLPASEADAQSVLETDSSIPKLSRIKKIAPRRTRLRTIHGAQTRKAIPATPMYSRNFADRKLGGCAKTTPTAQGARSNNAIGFVNSATPQRQPVRASIPL